MLAFFALGGCAPSETTVREVRCTDGSSLNDKRRCSSINKAGALLTVRVNTTTRDVQIVIKENDGNWGVDQIFLAGCSVIDPNNWQCQDRSTPESTYTTTIGMKNGVYYWVFRGNNLQFSKSSMRGVGRLLFEAGALSVNQAMGFPF